MPAAPTRLPLHSILTTCFALALGTPAHAAAQNAAPPALVPQPEHLTLGTGVPFVLGNGVALVAATDNSATRDVADYLRLRIAPIQTRAEPAAGSGTILLRITPGGLTGEGSYRLEVTQHEVRITGADANGLFSGVQTLLQLLPPDFESPPGVTPDRDRAWAIPPVVIEDRPRFRWRGVLLDVARHFLTVEQVKRQITLMARYKLNVLHWHLTDDQGWRLEVPALPRLTSVGAWRTEEDGTRTGGFYTADDIREVLDHARRHHVTVVPEIDLPGHLSAAIAAYPWIGCTGDSIAVPTTWGVFNDVLCLGSPRAMEFVDTVLETVLGLFPSPWIHLGGDEVPTIRWQSCAPCQALMRAEGLETEGELQGWFTRRMARILTERGRTLIGWDEIMDRGTGLPPGVVVQAWRGPDRTRAALRAGARVIASPGEAYLNAPPDALPLERVYAFDPLPDSLPANAAERLLGSEAAFWSEHITAANLDPMVWPRLLAFAEAVWTTGTREWVDFQARLQRDHLTRLHRLGVTLGPADRALATFEPGYDSVTREVFVRAVPGMPSVEIRTTPDPMPDSGTVTVAAVLNGNVLPLGRRFTLEPHLAWGRPVQLASPPSPRYQGTGPHTLTDHALGSPDLHDGFWQGWLGVDLEATIDLGRVADVQEVAGSFLHDFRSWIVAPSAFTVWLSMDGTAWQEVGTVTREEALPDDRPVKLRLVVSPPSTVKARWVRVRARSSGPLPDRHAGAERPSWIFGDEILVREEKFEV